MVRRLTLTITTERSVLGDELLYVTSPETNSNLLRVPQGSGQFQASVEIEVLDTVRYPEGSDPPIEIHHLTETWPRDRLRIESSAGLSQRAIRTMFPELYEKADEYDALPTPVVSRAARQLDTTAEDGPVTAWEPADERCRWCSAALLGLLDLDLACAQLEFLGVVGERLRVLTCPRCTCGGSWTYTDIDLFGGARWSDANRCPSSRSSGPWLELATARMGIGVEVPQPANLDDLYELEPLEGCQSQIGGRPRWVQHWSYPPCPRCEEPMPYLGQVELGDPPWKDEGLGTYFAFVDLVCCSACTIHQV